MNAVELILTVPAIVALVELLKSAGLPAKFCLIAALAVAVGLNVVDYLYGTSGLYAAIVQGVMLGLAAAGLYDTAKAAAKKP